MSQRTRIVIGPSMSPTPESEDNAPAPVSASAAPAAPPSVDGEIEQTSPNERSSKKKKRKRVKRRKSMDSDVLVEEAAVPGTDERPPPESAEKRKKKRRKSLDSDAASQGGGPAAEGDATAQETTKTSRKRKKSRKNHPEPEEDDAVTEETQPEPPGQEVEGPHPSPKRKKKKKKRKRSEMNPTSDDDLPLQNGVQKQDLIHGDNPHTEAEDAQHDDHPQRAPGDLESPAPAKKKRSRRKKPGEASSFDAHEVLVSQTVGGSPPSAQPPQVNSILNDEPLVEDHEDDASIIPSSQGQPARRESIVPLEPSPIQREPSDGSSNVDEHLRSHFAGIATNLADAVTDPVAEVMRENHPQDHIDWLHKRDHTPHQTPYTSARGSMLDTALPDLQPSQIKTEPESHSDSNKDSSTDTDSSPSSSDLNSRSPSEQKLQRLSRSRSRSASRAPSRSGHLADWTLGLRATARPDPYQQIPYSGPSSTGSNRSIPARLPSPSSTGSNRSIPAEIEPQPSPSRSKSSRSSRSNQAGRNHAFADVDAMDVDQPMVQDPTPPKQRVKKKATQPPQVDEADSSNGAAHGVNENMSEADRNGALTNGEAMDIDQSLVAEEISSARNKRMKKTTLGKEKTNDPTRPNETDAGIRDGSVVCENTGTQKVQSKPTSPKSDSNDDLADRNVHLLANGLSSPVKGADVEAPAQKGVLDDELPLDDMPAADEIEPAQPVRRPLKSKKRQPKASLVPDDGAPGSTVSSQNAATPREPMGQNGEPATSPKKKRKKRVLQPAAPVDDPEAEMEPANEIQAADPEFAVAENATATRNDGDQSGESGHQSQPNLKPKGKKKRILGQSKASLSLSQIEGDEDEEDFSTTFARRKSAKPSPVGGSNEPEQSQVGGSQAPSPEKPRKPKRKRRTENNASEDEMETLLAAGPSKGRKKRASNLALSDDDREAKRKRLSSPSKGKATGPWTQKELNDLGKVVEDFMEEHRLTRHEINKMIQAVPTKADSVNKDFWDRAEQAVSQRTRKQITERARRIYHNFIARGTWTQEQKEEVHELFETRPKKWAEIAGIINRDPKDVRDYWRNTYLVLESQIKSRWSKDEEERLSEIMEEALSKIRIRRENSDEPPRGSRAKSVDDEAMIDWQQISAAMDLTRSRQQCKWKWVDMREKGLVGDNSISLPTQPRVSARPSGNKVNGISEELANAREDYRGMGPEEKYRLIDAIKDSGAREDKHIPWRTLVDERFRTKWHRPVLRLVWYRLRQTVPDYEDQDVEANARFLVNFYHMHQMLPRFEDNQADEQAEEQVIHYTRGRRIWKRPSTDLRAVRERQRRSSSASSRASGRLSRKVSSEILNLSGDEEAEAGASGSRQSAEIGEDRGRRPHRTHDGLKSDEVSVTIPGHLKGEAAKKALAQARARAKKGKVKELAEKESRRVRSNSVAIDSESD